jgi:catechol 2,3-dioxygenase-like lactoylglutathione lyase family enzyme
MSLRAFDHVNIRTANLDGMIAWYARVLGLTTGPRPTFPFPGAWLYLGDQALIHLIGIDAPSGADAGDLRLEHFAFNAEGLPAFLAKLDDEGVAYRLGVTPGPPPTGGIVQVNIDDPDGNHLHVDFAEPLPSGAES